MFPFFQPKVIIDKSEVTDYEMQLGESVSSTMDSGVGSEDAVTFEGLDSIGQSQVSSFLYGHAINKYFKAASSHNLCANLGV